MTTPAPTPISLTLYGECFWISPYVFSVFVALREKQLPFAIRELSLAKREQHDPSYRDRALTGKVPALVHDKSWLTESSAIIEYLEDAFPDAPRVLPRDITVRARARAIMAWIRSDLLALREERPTTTMFYERATTPLTAAGEAAAATLLRIAEAIVPATEPHLFGEWSIADADLTFMLHRLIMNDHAVPARVAEYARAQWQRPSVQEFVTRTRIPLEPY